MSKTIWTVLLLVFLLTLAGCLWGSKSEKRIDGGEGEIFPSEVNGEWRDNSMDAYSAAFVTPLSFTEPEGAIFGGAEQYVMGKSTAMVFKKHLFQEVDDCWDEIKVFTDRGDEKSVRLDFWKDRLNQAWAVGSFFDSDHCIMMDVEKNENGGILYRFFETDENMQVIRQFYVNGMDEKEYEIPRQMLVDNDGNLHVLTHRQADELMHYYVASSGETTLNEAYKGDPLEQEMTLFYLYDGRVGFRADKELLLAEPESWEMNTLVRIKQTCMSCILWDENTLLYADGEGVHRSDLSGGKAETIYHWKNHGIACSAVMDVRISESQEIYVLYASREKVNYLKLTPTTEEVELLEVEFAVSSSAGRKYQTAVTEFNRRNPAWHIEMKTYGINDAGLLTKLIAGDGPAVIDTTLVGFMNHADLWEPLEEFYQQRNLEDELIPETLEIGKIGGTSYGLVTDFYLETMITFRDSPKEWDYGIFLDCLSEDGLIRKAVYNPINGTDGHTFAALFFHDFSENYLYDSGKCTTNFEGADFQKILDLASQSEKKENKPSAEDFLRGDAMCAVVAIQNPEDLAAIRVMGKDRLRFIGFPTQSGSAHYLVGSEPLCISVNAAAEEKQVARAFFSFLLSEEMQRECEWWSVRRNLLSEKFEHMDEMSFTNLIGFPSLSLEGHLDPSKDSESFYELLENAKPRKYLPKELSNILLDEISGYLAEAISREELIDHLNKRVELYLKEQK